MVDFLNIFVELYRYHIIGCFILFEWLDKITQEIQQSLEFDLQPIL